ncbi:HAMP domain-containing sensor histidine kinase, partial [Paraburkholderia sp. RL18-103-BIB-C]|uniref:sensor histidine kinase n=1 Tax=unclassified Paraburkholderia TaxID=2615204 RepID=UPI0038BC1380
RPSHQSPSDEPGEVRVETGSQPYENLTIRLIASVSCAVMALSNYWPSRLRKYYIDCSYVVVLYCLPFFHIFMSLKNHGNVVFIADSFMAVFFLVLLTDWRNTIVMLCVGTGLGVALYVATTVHPSFPADYVARLPTFILVVVGGSLFKFSERQLQDAKLRGAMALAGSIAHEMRNPLGRIQYSLDLASRALPEPTTDDVAQTLSRKQIEDLYAQLSQGQLAVQRGLQVIAMKLEEVNVKTIDTSRFTCIHAAEVVQKALAEYAYEREGERGIVTLSVVEDFSFHGDETLFMFVLFNLLKNALYYFKPYPDMTLIVTVDEPHVCVTDTGPGIAKSLQSRLFESFQTSGKADGHLAGTRRSRGKAGTKWS